MEPDGGCSSGGVSVGTSCHLDSAVLVVAEPDAGGLPLHLVLATEGAQVLRVLRDLHLFDGLPQGSTIPSVPSISLRYGQAINSVYFNTWCRTFQ